MKYKKKFDFFKKLLYNIYIKKRSDKNEKY